MDQTIVVGLFSALAAAVTGLIAYLIARRANSGSVETSAAVELWGENKTLRDYLTAQVMGLREQLIVSLAQATAATAKIGELLVKVQTEQEAALRAREETRVSREETRALRAAIDAVHREVVTGNAQTIGALADAAESRRINDIPVGERTAMERDHIAAVGLAPVGEHS